MPPFDGKYDPDAYISWEIAIDQKFACHEFPKNTRVRAATSVTAQKSTYQKSQLQNFCLNPM